MPFAVLGRSIRSYVLSIVFLGAIVPLALTGAWLTRGGVRSGEALLREQLEASLVNVVYVAEQRWELRRGDLLMLAESDVARRIVSAMPTAGDSVYLAQAVRAVDRSIAGFEYQDAASRVRWSSSSANHLVDTGPAPAARSAPATGPTIDVDLPITDSTLRRIGSLVARVRLTGLLPADSARPVVPGSSLAVRSKEPLGRGSVLVPLTSTQSFPEAGRDMIDGASWIVVRAAAAEVPLDIELGAPAYPYVAPFERAGRTGLAALIFVAFVALAVATYMTARLSGSLGTLLEAADAVSRGDLDRQVEAESPTEFTRLASAFNAMTDNLRRMLAELSQRRALAAVGEFAASLSHEVRNALTPVEVDLERVQERVADDPKSHALVARALSQVRRLDGAVTGALAVARSGNVVPKNVDIGETLRSAVHSAQPAFQATRSSVSIADKAESPVWVRGDPDALRQLLLNLLLNAGQALSPGGRATVTTSTANGCVTIAVADDGPGIAPEHLAAATQPFFTTRANGTGLGLPIACQIAAAHGGELSIDSTVGRGTTVTVILPASADE